MLSLDRLDATRAVAGLDDDVLSLLEEYAQHLARIRLILDDDDPAGRVRARRAVDAATNRVGLQRQAHDKSAAGVGAFTERFDRSAVKLDDAARERESDAEPASRPVDPLLRLHEQIED